MSKFTSNQLNVLSAASVRADGAVAFPEGMRGGVARKIVASLIDRKLLREVRAMPGTPAWRVADNGRKASLVITRGGREIVGALDKATDIPSLPLSSGGSGEKDFTGGGVSAEVSDVGPKSASRRTRRGEASWEVRAIGTGADRIVDVADLPKRPRAGSKQAALVDMLSLSGGATIAAIASSMSWLPHTTRAALTDLRRRGYSIARNPREGSPALYSIAIAGPGAARDNAPAIPVEGVRAARPSERGKRA